MSRTRWPFVVVPVGTAKCDLNVDETNDAGGSVMSIDRESDDSSNMADYPAVEKITVKIADLGNGVSVCPIRANSF